MQNLKAWYDSGVLYIIGIIVSGLISFIILKITLHHDKEQFKEQLDIQKQEHIEDIRIKDEEHKEILEKQIEVSRIEVMPFLVIDKGITVTNERNMIHFNISFFNKGNGTAVGIMGKYIDELSRNNLCVMSETYLGIYGCSCPFNYESSIVRKDEKCRFSMYQNITEKTNNIKNQDEVSFSVLYNDMFFNQYEQKFLFSFKENENNNTIEILRVETSFPVLVELNSQQKRTMYY